MTICSPRVGGTQSYIGCNISDGRLVRWEANPAILVGAKKGPKIMHLDNVTKLE